MCFVQAYILTLQLLIRNTMVYVTERHGTPPQQISKVEPDEF